MKSVLQENSKPSKTLIERPAPPIPLVVLAIAEPKVGHERIQDFDLLLFEHVGTLATREISGWFEMFFQSDGHLPGEWVRVGKLVVQTASWDDVQTELRALGRSWRRILVIPAADDLLRQRASDSIRAKLAEGISAEPVEQVIPAPTPTRGRRRLEAHR